MALDYQSLVATVNDYGASGNVSGAMMLKLALLKNIALTVAPGMPTDFQTLLSGTNVPGYISASDASLATALELALLEIIADNVGGGGGSTAVTHGTGSPITNGISVVTYKIYINDTDSTLWAVSNGAWIQLV